MTLRLKENIEQKNFLITLKNLCCGYYPNNILTILTPLVFAPCDRVETLAMTAFSGGGVPNSKPSKAFRHINPKRIRFTKTKQCNGLNVLSSQRPNVFKSRPYFPIRQNQHKLNNL